MLEPCAARIQHLNGPVSVRVRCRCRPPGSGGVGVRAPSIPTLTPNLHPSSCSGIRCCRTPGARDVCRVRFRTHGHPARVSASTRSPASRSTLNILAWTAHRMSRPWSVEAFRFRFRRRSSPLGIALSWNLCSGLVLVLGYEVVHRPSSAQPLARTRTCTLSRLEYWGFELGVGPSRLACLPNCCRSVAVCCSYIYRVNLPSCFLHV